MTTTARWADMVTNGAHGKTLNPVWEPKEELSKPSPEECADINLVAWEGGQSMRKKNMWEGLEAVLRDSMVVIVEVMLISNLQPHVAQAANRFHISVLIPSGEWHESTWGLWPCLWNLPILVRNTQSIRNHCTEGWSPGHPRSVQSEKETADAWPAWAQLQAFFDLRPLTGGDWLFLPCHQMLLEFWEFGSTSNSPFEWGGTDWVT